MTEPDERIKKYIGDFIGFTLFRSKKDPRATDGSEWQGNLIPFELDGVEFEQWLRANWRLRNKIYFEWRDTPTPYMNFTLENTPDYLKKIREEIEFNVYDSRETMNTECNSLFLFDFLKKLIERFPVNEPIYMNVGNEFHIMRFDMARDKWDFLEEIHNHYEIVDNDSWLLPGGRI